MPMNEDYMRAVDSTVEETVETVEAEDVVPAEKTEGEVVEEKEETAEIPDGPALTAVDANSVCDLKELYENLFVFDKVDIHTFVKACHHYLFDDKVDSMDGTMQLHIAAAIQVWYDNIKLPRISTTKSAGYDFFAPFNFILNQKSEIVIPTGIKWIVNHETLDKVTEYMRNVDSQHIASTDGTKYEDLAGGDQLTALTSSTIQILTNILDNSGFVLNLYPRSGMAYEYGLRIANTVPVIDEDYWQDEESEGQIMIKLCMDTPRYHMLKYTSPEEGGLNMHFAIDTDRDDCEGKRLEVHAGDRIAQGIVTRYYRNPAYTEENLRTGGLGSTGE